MVKVNKAKFSIPADLRVPCSDGVLHFDVLSDGVLHFDVLSDDIDIVTQPNYFLIQ